MTSSISRRRFLGALGTGVGGVMMPGLLEAGDARRWSAAGLPQCHILDYGARGDGRFDNRLAIQRAIDTCAARGGGTVHVPAGRFRTGTLYLKSHVRLELGAGAVLVGSSSPRDYDRRTPTPHVPQDGWGSALLIADGQEDVSIGGHGTITGGGLALTPSGERGPFRPRLVALERCRDVRVEGLTVRDSDRWTLHLYQCEQVRVRGLGIHAGLHVLNTDGIDVDGCSGVLISDCHIAVGDDCVVLKTTDYLGPPRPCRDVTVTNCTLATRSSALKIGTETHADLENVVFSNCVIYQRDGVQPDAGVALESVDGAHVRGVAVSNIAMRGVKVPIFLRLGNRGRRQPVPTPGTLRDLVIDNVVATDASMTSSITGIPGHPVEHVTLGNVRIQTRGGAAAAVAERPVEELEAAYPKSTMFGELPAYGLYLRHAAEISVRGLHVDTTTADARPLIVGDDVEALRIDGLSGGSAARAGSVIRLRDVRDASVGGAPAPRDARTGVRVEGPRSREILLHTGAGTASVSRGPEVAPDAVTLRP